MKRGISAAAALLALCGCVAPGPKLEAFHPEHNDQARYTRDLNECDYEARKATGSYTPDTRGMRTEFGRALSAQMDMNSRQIDIGMSCMRARGYEFRPAGTVVRAPDIPQAGPQPAFAHGTHAGHAIIAARNMQCSNDPRVNISHSEGDSEIYWVTCNDGRPLQLRCTASSCVSMNR